jgi:N-acetylglutamate synthase-like GNAT family acetyltransferase
MTSPSTDLVVRAATAEDRGSIEQLLTARDLPTAGVREHLDGFVVAVRGGALLGCAGVEHHGEVGLLRSVAVMEDAGGRGVGHVLVLATLDRARALGLRELYLLTTTASGYFPRFGFETVGREALPPALSASEELRGACPASAIAMRLTP